MSDGNSSEIRPFSTIVDQAIQTQRKINEDEETRRTSPRSVPRQLQSTDAPNSESQSIRGQSINNTSIRRRSTDNTSIRNTSIRNPSIRRQSIEDTSIRSGNQTKVAIPLPDEQIMEQNGIDMKSLSLKAAEELSKRPKNGDIYNEVAANVESIEKRLKYLSENSELFSIDAAIEIADAAYLLRLLRKPNNEIEMAGQMAHRGALLILQADMLYKKGQELLEQSKSKLKLTIL